MQIIKNTLGHQLFNIYLADELPGAVVRPDSFWVCAHHMAFLNKLHAAALKRADPREVKMLWIRLAIRSSDVILHFIIALPPKLLLSIFCVFLRPHQYCSSKATPFEEKTALMKIYISAGRFFYSYKFMFGCIKNDSREPENWYSLNLGLLHLLIIIFPGTNSNMFP